MSRGIELRRRVCALLRHPRRRVPVPRRVPHPTSGDSELSYTVGVTESTPYGCQFCDKAFPGSATSRDTSR
ncbi:hypothetical protein CEXT_803511 [Caerostris extrusa]|uniref:Uncharacterized protein n=1 Tax=Caerostris extrusa TaxID=172846 RepID=A0AAV4W082_CAEEX|nr:hypothetical protein CEXT_803511 [Caerostris extrusa]